MIQILKKIQSVIRNRTTYRAGLLQAKVYRILKVYTGDKLSPHGISTVDWAFLGLLLDNEHGMQSSHIAEELGVEAPFVTVVMNKLKKTFLVDSKPHAKDSRVKIIFLTSKGKAFVIKTEKVLRDEMKFLLHGAHAKDILSYLTILELIISNSKNVLLRTSRLTDYEGV